jgi:hypothetical protein
MAKQTLHQHWIGRVVAALIFGLAVVGCGSTNAASSAPAASAFPVAPIESSPEQTVIELSKATLDNDRYLVAPVEGSPEQTSTEIDRHIAACNGEGEPSMIHRNVDYCAGIGDWQE